MQKTKTALVSSVSNLRPTSIMPILSRIVEQLVVSDNLIPCIPRENLVDQYAYKATGSTTDTIGRMLDQLMTVSYTHLTLPTIYSV